jgi:hypothetical protein
MADALRGTRRLVLCSFQRGGNRGGSLIRDPPEKLPRIRAAFRARKFVLRNLLAEVLQVICAEPLTPNSCSDRIDRRSKHAVQAVDPWRGGTKLRVRSCHRQNLGISNI